MKKILLTVLASVFITSIGAFGLNAFAEKNESQTSATQSSYTTAERTDDDPFAESESKPTVEKETPTFYYILVGVAGVIIIFAIIGLITSKNKK